MTVLSFVFFYFSETAPFADANEESDSPADFGQWGTGDASGGPCAARAATGNHIWEKSGKKTRTLFTFGTLWCIVCGNRVGDPALSATGTGSCPEDEGFFHDEVTAPAVAYGIPSFM